MSDSMVEAITPRLARDSRASGLYTGGLMTGGATTTKGAPVAATARLDPELATGGGGPGTLTGTTGGP
jgi:hypothetical protein